MEDENKMLRNRLKELEGTALNAINAKQELSEELQKQKEALEESTKEIIANNEDDDENKVDAKEVEEMAEAFKAVKNQMATELEMNVKTQKELEGDLTSTKHQLLEVQHQMNLAEKELERKFSQTGAYKNLKKMLTAKNEQIKELRSKLREQDEDSDNE